MEILNAFTVDVEDYFHVSAFERQISRQDWDRYESRVVCNTHRLLDLLARHDVKATFFVLGWVAERQPHLVRAIHAAGHEIGCHSQWHRLIYEQSPDEFRADLRQSRDVLQDIIGERILSYRAPSFSITEKSLWALDNLAQEGFLIDSSVFPIHHDRYGIPGARPDFHWIDTAHGPLWECPPAVVGGRRLHLPVGGGGYLRLYPLASTVRCLSSLNRKACRRFVVYVHPWEIDPDQPRLGAGSYLSRFRHYVGLSQNYRKLDRLLSTFRFGRLCDILALDGRHECAAGQEEDYTDPRPVMTTTVS